MRRVSPGSAILVGLLALFFAGYVAYPLASTVVQSLRVGNALSLGHYLSLLDPRNVTGMEALGNSIFVSALSVAISACVGVLFAVAFTQCRFPFRNMLSRLAVVPIALPPLVGVIAFLFVFGESGILPRVAGALLGKRTVPFALDGIAAIVAVHVYSFYVYTYLFVSTTLRQMDVSVMEAASSLGSGSWNTFRRVIVPALKPAILGAAILTFMASMASFSAPFLFGGGRRFLTLEIYTAKLNGDMDLAATEAVILILVSVVFFLLLRLSSRRDLAFRSAKGAGRAGVLHLNRTAQIVIVTATLGLLTVALLPLAAIVLISLTQEGSWTWQVLPSAYTVDNFVKLFSEPQIFQPVANSVIMAGLTLAGVLIIGVTASYITVKGVLRRWRNPADVLLTLPYAVPGTAVALNLILAFNSPTFLAGGAVLVGTFWILPLAYIVRTYPLVVRSTSAALDGLDESLLEAGESFGAGGWRRFRVIVLPLVLPGVLSGAILAVVAALGEFVSSILLYTYSSRPISVEILSQLRMYNFGGAAAYSVILLLTVLLVVGVGSGIGRTASKGA